jgi:Helix-turn-helix domain
MTPDQRASLRTLAAALPVGCALPVLREWLLDLLDGSPASSPVDVAGADLTVAQVAARFRRAESTVRGWILRGRLTGCYRFQGREIRIPPAALAAFEAGQRPTDRCLHQTDRMSTEVDWAAYKRAS